MLKKRGNQNIRSFFWNISNKGTNVIQTSSSFVLVMFYAIYKRYGLQNKIIGIGMLLSNVCIHVIAEHSSCPYQGNPHPPTPHWAYSCLGQSFKHSAILSQNILVAFLQFFMLQLCVHLTDVGCQFLWAQALTHLCQLALVLLRGKTNNSAALCEML